MTVTCESRECVRTVFNIERYFFRGEIQACSQAIVYLRHV